MPPVRPYMQDKQIHLHPWLIYIVYAPWFNIFWIRARLLSEMLTDCGTCAREDFKVQVIHFVTAKHSVIILVINHI